MTASEQRSFDAHIRPLFREVDRDEMLWAFDLFDEADVRCNADVILERLEQGDMPCDGAWPDERVERFRSWVSGAEDTSCRRQGASDRTIADINRRMRRGKEVGR